MSSRLLSERTDRRPTTSPRLAHCATCMPNKGQTSSARAKFASSPVLFSALNEARHFQSLEASHFWINRRPSFRFSDRFSQILTMDHKLNQNRPVGRKNQKY